MRLSTPRRLGRRLGRLALLLSLVATTTGCNLLVVGAVLFGREPTKLVQAEWPYLEAKKVCILVWAEMDTLFEYPNVQYEVAEHVRQAMEANVKDVAIIPTRQVDDLQRKDVDWDRSPPATVGARFGADRVLMIEITQYTTREPESPHLYRGRISANVRVYDTGLPKAGPSWSGVVETAFPPNSVGHWGSNDRTIRRATMEAFAIEVAGKFHDRQVKVE